jgi:hypothetical protein
MYWRVSHSDVMGDTGIETRPANPKATEWAERSPTSSEDGAAAAVSLPQRCLHNSSHRVEIFARSESAGAVKNDVVTIMPLRAPPDLHAPYIFCTTSIPTGLLFLTPDFLSVPCHHPFVAPVRCLFFADSLESVKRVPAAIAHSQSNLPGATYTYTYDAMARPITLADDR